MQAKKRHGKTKPDHTTQGHTIQHNTIQTKTRQDHKTNNTIQDKTRQGNPIVSQYKTRQYSTTEGNEGYDNTR